MSRICRLVCTVLDVERDCTGGNRIRIHWGPLLKPWSLRQCQQKSQGQGGSGWLWNPSLRSKANTLEECAFDPCRRIPCFLYALGVLHLPDGLKPGLRQIRRIRRSFASVVEKTNFRQTRGNGAELVRRANHRMSSGLRQ